MMHCTRCQPFISPLAQAREMKRNSKPYKLHLNSLEPVAAVEHSDHLQPVVAAAVVVVAVDLELLQR